MIPYLIAHQVNAQVNENTTYCTDMAAYAKPDFWDEANGTGDCENESKADKTRRESFKARHAKNIAKGKMSAAWWSSKTKW